ncbi:hypothetical protein KP509_26G041300 [Ceratopteris richardii]|uniref:Uncharacterized protein n=1 Tax=Ceratopteris richardii TaxID=49495 RepID=A0A8T2RLM1_CERRI|nr:hypothetical protein KP509_26G041300 [Ceratopteris richardii]
MAIVFKIKHGETLRRWVVSESMEEEMLPVTLEQLQNKVREIFQLSPETEFVITYVDKENDVITIGDDHDLADAYVVQRLNPLRLEVQILPSGTNASNKARAGNSPANEFNMEGFLKFLFPQETTEALQRFLQQYAAELFDPSMPIATLIMNAQDAFKEFLANAGMPECQRPGSSDKFTHHHPYKHPHDGRCKSMPKDHNHKSSHGDGRCKSMPKENNEALHLGVACDSCGACPIRGPRYKSNKITDFDLCAACFAKHGKEEDYSKIEYPLHHGHYRPPFLRTGFMGPPKCGRGPPFMAPPFMGSPMCGRGPFAGGPCSWKRGRSFGRHNNEDKLDAHFVKDVTIFDGTELTPGTKFTKIWSMRNNGSLPWPRDTQLLHIGGDDLSSQEAVGVEVCRLPESGLACGEEVELSVDLVAPDKAGRYTSYWRLVAPSGQKFGQRVWVTIQVVPQGELSPLLQESMKDEEVNGTKNGPSTIVVPILSTEDLQIRDLSKEDMIVDNSTGLNVRDVATKVTDTVPDLSDEMEGFSLVEKPQEFTDEEMVDNTGKSKMEEELKLQSLESMGFMDRELNSALLAKNDGNMQQTLDDLLASAGWDSAVQDLQEMGFLDQETNVKLLTKYKGSIKAVVKELVQKEKGKAKV